MSSNENSIGSKLIGLGKTLAHAQYRIVTAAAAFQASGEWHPDAPTAAHWIADRLDVHLGTAREWIRIGLALEDLPLITEALERHEISYSKVRTLTRLATEENEAELLALARGVPASRLACAMAEWSNRNEEPAARDARHRRDRTLSWWIQPDGIVAGFFRLPPMEAAGLTSAVTARVASGLHRGAVSAEHAPADGLRWPTLCQQRADALVELVTNGGLQVETEIVIHVRGDGCSLDDGTPITETAVERVAPLSLIRALVHDAERRPINASRRRRHPDARQKKVVMERDRSCVDCGSSELLEYDHVPAFEESRQTVVEELELRCGPCHRRRHDDAA